MPVCLSVTEYPWYFPSSFLLLGSDEELEQIPALRPVLWRWKSDKTDADPEHGYVAQEVERTLLSLVSVAFWEDGSERKFLSTKEMIPFLVAAIQEQQAQIDALRAKTK